MPLGRLTSPPSFLSIKILKFPAEPLPISRSSSCNARESLSLPGAVSSVTANVTDGPLLVAADSDNESLEEEEEVEGGVAEGVASIAALAAATAFSLSIAAWDNSCVTSVLFLVRSLALDNKSSNKWDR